jgi:LysM repeat protein
MARRNPVRYLAPLALAFLFLGVYLIVHQHLGVHAKPSVPSQAAGGRAGPAHRRRPRYYLVRPGDILGTIAARTGVSLAQLEALNPTLDPNSLQAGQRLRLRR